MVNEDHEALEVLMHQLQEIYTEGVGDPYKMPPSMIKAETVCAAKYENDWHRYVEPCNFTFEASENDNQL